MNNKRLRQIQEEVHLWSLSNFGNQDPINPLLGIVEEVGELCHAILKRRQGIRGTEHRHELNAKDALGDILIYMCDFAARNSWDLEDILENTWNEVKKRNWKANPNPNPNPNRNFDEKAF